MHSSILLTDAEITLLDDGQEWWEPGDTVYLGGEIPTDAEEDAGKQFGWSLDLNVNGETQDNWTTWRELPEIIRVRLLAEADEE